MAESSGPLELCLRPVANEQVCSTCGQSSGPEFRWVVLEGGPDGEPVTEEFDTRGEAKQAALDLRQQREVPVLIEDRLGGEGTREFARSPAILLLREDGSLHSEMRPETPLPFGNIVVDGGNVTEGAGS